MMLRESFISYINSLIKHFFTEIVFNEYVYQIFAQAFYF